MKFSNKYMKEHMQLMSLPFLDKYAKEKTINIFFVKCFGFSNENKMDILSFFVQKNMMQVA